MDILDPSRFFVDGEGKDVQIKTPIVITIEAGSSTKRENAYVVRQASCLTPCPSSRRLEYD